jgi:chromosome segregation ATPase
MTEPRSHKPAKNAALVRVREVGQREETLKRQLTATEIQALREELEALLDDEDNIDEKKKEASKNFASQLETNKLQQSNLRRRIKSKEAEEKVLVKEYLTKANEIVRIRADTDEQIGQRTATKAELQEEMFPDKKPEGGSPETGEPQNDAQPQPAGLEFGGDAA